MIICPSCRLANDEKAAVCSNCGASLEPGIAALAPVRRTESERPMLEIQEPKRPSKWRPVVILGGLLAIGLAVGGYLLFRPDPCAGTNFQSVRFGYCVLVPHGWEAGDARFGAQVTLDQFAPPTNSATVIVEAVDLSNEDALEDWSQRIRQRDEEAGLQPGEAVETTVDGVRGLQWDVRVEPADGRAYRMREVVVVRDHFGWRIALSDAEDGFDSSSVVFADMLDTWKFR